jgi:hypothetical protein
VDEPHIDGRCKPLDGINDADPVVQCETNGPRPGRPTGMLPGVGVIVGDVDRCHPIPDLDLRRNGQRPPYTIRRCRYLRCHDHLPHPTDDRRAGELLRAALARPRFTARGYDSTVQDHEAAFFPYDVDYRFLAMWSPFGLRPRKDGVTITADRRFVATFGLLKVSTTLDNIVGAHITRDYRWWTAVGARMSFVDDGLTFGTNRRAGVCVHFRDKVRSPLKRKGHSALTVTVGDLEGLVRALGEDGPVTP